VPVEPNSSQPTLGHGAGRYLAPWTRARSHNGKSIFSLWNVNTFGGLYGDESESVWSGDGDTKVSARAKEVGPPKTRCFYIGEKIVFHIPDTR
jgi:hypothetical protein